MTEQVRYPKKKTSIPASQKMMDYLALRDHSEKELRRKLKKFYEDSEIEKAIEYGRQNSWIASNEEDLLKLSHKVAETLHRKKKGILYINSYLQQKGLPRVSLDSDRECEKALQLLNTQKLKKWIAEAETSRDAEGKCGRFLLSRGFDRGTVQKALKNCTSTNQKSSHKTKRI